MASFLTDENKGVFIIEDGPRKIAMLMYRIRNIEIVEDFEIFNELDRDLFPSDGSFLEIYQLWVSPAYRRKGLATKLKKQIEEEAIKRNISLIYTNTEETNFNVIHLNMRLGYHEVRRGPIWDEIVRISMIKNLP
ncbi:GNAT family N-acetyltransferase [Paenibacillus validus]|uniref:GNAT family N-acetyltransferase n=1 Tax=Paenibacillus validus TaxID=44253 RepID=A0A7X2ZFJ8_9BACL|nr:GNAT family N-acetyltransferase [Paenibacillus validus]MUG74008.1 GNAT family N-acetyltransferase [Paenibacillus validus]